MQHPIRLTHYLVLSDLGPGYGLISQETLHPHFHDACHAWADQMDQNHQSWVIEAKLNAPALDVTDEARETCIRWHIENHSDLPDWLLTPADDEADAPAQRGYDAAREAA